MSNGIAQAIGGYSGISDHFKNSRFELLNSTITALLGIHDWQHGQYQGLAPSNGMNANGNIAVHFTCRPDIAATIYNTLVGRSICSATLSLRG